MPVLQLSSTQQEEIFSILKGVFADLKCLDYIMPSLKMLIYDATKLEIDPLFLLNLEERYLSHQPHLQGFLFQSQQSSAASKAQKELFQQLKLILTTTVVYLYSFHSFVKNSLYLSIDELLCNYPLFKEGITKQYPRPEDRWQEMQYLLHFRNFMVIALMLIPAKGNKTFLLKVVERLEGSGKLYIMGSGQKAAVTRRLEIFHQESCIPLAKKTGKRQREKQYQLLLQNETFFTARGEEKENYSQTKDCADGVRVQSQKSSQSLIQASHHHFSQSTALLPSNRSLPMSDFPQYTIESRISSFENSSEVMAEETRDLLLNEEYTGSFTEELHDFLMNEDE